MDSLRDSPQGLGSRKRHFRRTFGVRKPSFGEVSQNDAVDSQTTCRGARKKKRGRFQTPQAHDRDWSGNWKIVALAGARSSDEAMEVVKETCEFLDADLNEWVRAR